MPCENCDGTGWVLTGSGAEIACGCRSAPEALASAKGLPQKPPKPKAEDPIDQGFDAVDGVFDWLDDTFGTKER